MSIIRHYAHRFNVFVHGLFNRKPAYLITKSGPEVHFFNFSDTENLPFDKQTYSETQLFIGNWANPWYVDIDSITDAYPNFTEETITTIDDVFAEKHVYPSQRWKLVANLDVLEQMYASSGLNQERVVRLLYAVAGGVTLLIILYLNGGG